MPLLEHLRELRKRVIRSAAAISIAAIVGWVFYTPIITTLAKPVCDLKSAQESGTENCGALYINGVLGPLNLHIKVAILTGLLLAAPIWLYQLWAFIAPGLYAKEKKAFLPFLIATPVLFTMGASLAYFWVMPTAFKWFIGFQGDRGGLQLEALPGIEEYLNLVMQFIFAFGVSFLLPVLLMLLNRAGIVTRAQLVSARRYVIVGITALAAVITPPDVLSQLMLAIPLLILFEGTLIVMRFAENKDAAEKAKAEAEAGA
jgi:sec-independent protein translocase protein TatC